MAYHLTKQLLCLGATALFYSAASAQTVSPAVSDAVDACVQSAGIAGTYYVRPVSLGGTASLTVLPGGGVSNQQSQQINACVAQATQTKVQTIRTPARPRARTRAAQPTDTAGCLALYKERLNATRNGRESTSLKIVSRVFGRAVGRQVLEHEYDGCLNRIDSYANRCPTGVFSNGSGYCIKRPIW